jgi:hypothetical protein
MLAKIAMFDSHTMRALGLALIALLGLILSFFGVDENVFSERGQRVLDALLLVIATGSALWAGHARATKPTPPLTEQAKVATQAAISDGKLKTTTGDAVRSAQGGFAGVSMIGAILMLGSIIVLGAGLNGCTHTSAALKAADTPSDFALVFLEGYDSALKSANQLKDAGSLAGSDLERVRAAELKAWPLVQRIDPLRVAYEKTKSAEDATALQLAIDKAIREAAAFITIVRELRGKNPAASLDEAELWILERDSAPAI